MVKPNNENQTNQIEEQQDLRERAVVVAVIRDGQPVEQAEEFLAELEFLAETADIVTVRRFTQRLPQPSSRIYVGPGKLDEIAAYCAENEIDSVNLQNLRRLCLGITACNQNKSVRVMLFRTADNLP